MFKLLAAIILTALCIRYLDLGIASFIAEHMGTKFLFSHRVSSLPDLLLAFVAGVSVFCWTCYWLLSRRGIDDRRTLYCKIAGTSLPLAYFAKDILKWIFGRTDTRLWLTGPDLHAFHWFHGGGDFNGFPSGHMLVLTPLLFAIGEFCPRSRIPVWLAGCGLAFALLITEYHFLGDLLAGTCLGLLLHLGVKRFYTGRQ